jgi:hypothetical protein
VRVWVCMSVSVSVSSPSPTVSLSVSMSPSVRARVVVVVVLAASSLASAVRRLFALTCLFGIAVQEQYLQRQAQKQREAEEHKAYMKAKRAAEIEVARMRQKIKQ